MEAGRLEKIVVAQDSKQDEKLSLNVASFKNINLEKSEKKTRSLLKYRIIEMVAFSLLALFLGNYIASNWIEPHLAISGIIFHVFTLVALVGSIGQVLLLQQIDYSKPLVEIRKKIEQVNTHRLLFIKLIFLSAPVWWVYAIVAFDFFLGVDLYLYLNSDFELRYLVANFLLIIPLLWVFNKLSFRNLHVTWVRKTIGLLVGTKTKKALEFLNDIEEYER